MSEERAAQLRDEGKYEAAAKLYAELGQFMEAAELYAKTWKWQEAMQAAIAADAYALAYRYSLETADLKTERATLAESLKSRPEEAEKAAEFAKIKGRLADAAALYETIGNLEEAAALFEKAGELSAAAACHERSGDKRAAGRLYEKHLKTQSDDTDASLKLGQILTSFGRWAHAARALQDACNDKEHAPSALALMVACFDALHMQDAARSALERLTALRSDDHSRAVVGDVAAFLEETFGDERGLAGLGAGDDAGELVAGRYRIERVLGAGGSGRVLLARDAFYERAVAIKMLNVASGSRGRDSYRRFAREAQVAAGMDHPAVVRVFEFNPDGPFLVMEYMAGGTLEERLARVGTEGEKEETIPPLPLDTSFAIAKAMLRGLEAVHRRGVIHRDLKPANVFFSEAGDVKIGDFGVAHLQDQNSTLTGAMMGTLAYMTPEQITGREKPRAGTDLYAFGIILFRMLTGRLPFDGPDFVTEHLESIPKRVSKARPALGTRFDALMGVLLAKELKDRPSSVSDVLSLLDKIDWTDPDHDAYAQMIALERPLAAPKRVAPAASEPAGGERYVLIEPREAGAYLAEDTWLNRQVRVEPLGTTQRVTKFRLLAAADNPFLQAVFDIDAEAGRAILEIPRGRPFDKSHATHSKQNRAQLGEALKSLHAAGVVHGAINPRAIRIGAGRAVLLLPLSDATPEITDISQKTDWIALDGLF